MAARRCSKPRFSNPRFSNPGQAARGSLGLASASAQYTGEAASDYAGASVAGVGDVDADGYHDLLIGAEANDAGGTDAGAAYLIFGSGF